VRQKLIVKADLIFSNGVRGESEPILCE